jgi:hypothetical protein
MIEIWEPRYHDNVVLVAKHKVMPGDNTIVFTKSKKLVNKEYHIPGKTIMSCPLDTNGKIECYAVPLHLVCGEE